MYWLAYSHCINIRIHMYISCSSRLYGVRFLNPLRSIDVLRRFIALCFFEVIQVADVAPLSFTRAEWLSSPSESNLW